MGLVTLLALCVTVLLSGERADAMGRKKPEKVVGIHLLSWTSDSLLAELGNRIPDLADQGINLIFLEVDYGFEFESHPELRQGGPIISRDGARRFAEICRKHGIRLIPQFQMLGHQSWAGTTFSLLTVYPELDLTPGAFTGNEGLYCREWDLTNPRVNEIVFPMVDEIVDAFDADGIHVGMDEIFLLGAEESLNTKGKDPARLFAQAVNEYHAHFVKEKGLEMFMWGDRFIDGEVHGFGEYESSLNGTAPAVDMIPRDIVICDWHYEPRPAYSSIPMFIEKGFRVLPSSWRKPSGVRALVKYSYGLEHPKMIGHLFTTWSRLDGEQLVNYRPLRVGVTTIRDGRYFDVTFDPQHPSTDELVVELATQRPDLAIYYRVDPPGRAGEVSEPDQHDLKYDGPIHLQHSATVRAVAYRHSVAVSDMTERRFYLHKGLGRPVELTVTASPKYPAVSGDATLVNGVTGSESYGDGQWVGAEGTGLEAVVDLGAATDVSGIVVHSLNNRSNWVHQATEVRVAGSKDGTTYTALGSVSFSDEESAIVTHVVAFEPSTARFVKVTIPPRTIPKGRSGAGNPAWLFVDEIIIE